MAKTGRATIIREAPASLTKENTTWATCLGRPPAGTVPCDEPQEKLGLRLIGAYLRILGLQPAGYLAAARCMSSTRIIDNSPRHRESSLNRRARSCRPAAGSTGHTSVGEHGRRTQFLPTRVRTDTGPDLRVLLLLAYKRRHFLLAIARTASGDRL